MEIFFLIAHFPVRCLLVPSHEEQQTKLRVEYERRLTTHGIQDPKGYPENSWKKDVSQRPPLDLGKLFEYIVDNSEF